MYIKPSVFYSSRCSQLHQTFVLKQFSRQLSENSLSFAHACGEKDVKDNGNKSESFIAYATPSLWRREKLQKSSRSLSHSLFVSETHKDIKVSSDYEIVLAEIKYETS